MKKEKIYFCTFTTKKCLITRINKSFKDEYINSQPLKRPIIVITSSLTIKDSITFEFKFENNEVADEVYNEIINKLNSSEETEFINFDAIINPIKEKFNDLIGE